MFFRKKASQHAETAARTSPYKVAMDEMDKNLEQKKQTMTTAQKLSRKIGDSFPIQMKKPRTA